MRAYINPETGEVQAAEKSPGKPWHVLPRRVGIIWNVDQSNNQIDLNGSRAYRWDYSFDPATDLELVSQYADQLQEMFR